MVDVVVVVVVPGGVVLVAVDGAVVVGVVGVVGVVVLVIAVVVVLVVGGTVGVVELVEEVVLVVVSVPTENAPFMDGLWASQKNAYCPFVNVTSQVSLPVPGTLVASSTPGPWRWKSWIEAISVTSIVYAPGASVVTGVPPCVSEIVKPGPTVALSTGPAALPVPATSVAAM